MHLSCYGLGQPVADLLLHKPQGSAFVEHANEDRRKQCSAERTDEKRKNIRIDCAFSAHEISRDRVGCQPSQNAGAHHLSNIRRQKALRIFIHETAAECPDHASRKCKQRPGSKHISDQGCAERDCDAIARPVGKVGKVPVCKYKVK